MTYNAIFTGWENLQLEDLLVAYRKAKADCFFENTFPTAVRFAEYEQNLLLNLKKLLKNFSVHDKFHRTLILSGFCFLKIAKISLNSSFFPKPIKR